LTFIFIIQLLFIYTGQTTPAVIREGDHVLVIA